MENQTLVCTFVKQLTKHQKHYCTTELNFKAINQLIFKTMALIKKHTIKYDNGNTKTTINFLGIPVISHETEKESTTVEGRISEIEKILGYHRDSIQRLEMR